MTRSVRRDDEPDDLPPALSSLWRMLELGYSAEPRLLVASFAMTVMTALPDVLVALWLKLLADGVLGHRPGEVRVAAAGLAASAAATWLMKVVFDRVQRRFRDRVSIALESHVARLQASVSTIDHQERPLYLDRLAVLRNQVFTLDHLFMSIFSTVGWILRLAFTIVLLASVHPALVLFVVLAAPAVFTATWRPAVERRSEEAAAPFDRRARHLFVLGTTAPAGKEVRVTGNGPQLVDDRRAEWDRWYSTVAPVRWASALWHSLAWAVFGGAYVGAIVFVAQGIRAGAGSVLLVVVAGSRLSQYVGAAVGELGFLRGIWLDSSKRLSWLEDYASAIDEHSDRPVPDRIDDGIVFEEVSFRYPGTERLVLEDVDLRLPAGAVVAIVGENGAGKTTLVKLLARMYEPTSGRILVDGEDLRRMDTATWRTRMAGAFQDFFRFELRAAATVGLGDEPRLDDRAGVERAVGRAGADELVADLDAGLDTQLGPAWDAGVDLSHGQWQKLSLARGFMREQPLVLVLDEPTSALDAETEHALFEGYAAAARAADAQVDGPGRGRITILVSHRFSTVRMADLIVVLDGSRVLEVGSHAQLMARRGKYAELYGIQAAAYR